MDEIKVGLVGLGAIATSTHLPTLLSIDGVNVTAAAETDRKTLERIARRHRIASTYRAYDEMYDKEDLDAVFVCLPNFLHYRAVKRALENELNVFCEKPMGLDADEAARLVRLARRKRLKLAVGYNKPLDPGFEAAGKMVASMKLGRILQVHGTYIAAGPYAGAWQPRSDWILNDKFGALYDLGSHLFSLMLCVLSDTIESVSAKAIRTMYDVEVLDNIAGVFRTKELILGTFNVGWKTAAFGHTIEVYGTGASILASSNELETHYRGYGDLEKTAGHLRFAKDLLFRNLRNVGNPQSQSLSYLKEDNAFVEAVRSGRNPLMDGELGLRVLEVLEAVKRSIETGVTIKVYHRAL